MSNKAFDEFIESINRVNSNRITMVPPFFMKYAMGLADEGGEFIDMLKNALYYGVDVDYDHVAEELGDTLYFVMLGCMHLALISEDCGEVSTPEEEFYRIMQMNIDKLKARFPHGFDAKAAQPANRNLEAEKKAMTQNLERLDYRPEPTAKKSTSDRYEEMCENAAARVHQLETEEVIDDG